MNTISLLGVGLMGQALGQRLIEQNYTLTLYNRSVEKCQPLAQLGAEIAESAQQAIQKSDISIVFLSDANAIESVLSSVESAYFKNKYIIQMATIAPDESRMFADYIRQRQGHYLECPVLGSLPEARSGNLILMAAGEQQDYQTLLPLLETIGKEPVLFGDIGKGSTIKLAMNQLIAGLTSSFSLSLALIEKEDVNVEKFMKVVRDSALYAPTFDKKLERMLQQDYSKPNFPTKHLAKDTGLFLDVAQRLNIETCALEGINQLLNKTLEQGLADTDYSALYAAVSKPQKE